MQTVAGKCLDVIAIDGPAGSGKSSVSIEIAKRLKMRYLDTGAIYRAITLVAIKKGISPKEGRDIASEARKHSFMFEFDGESGTARMLLDNQDVTRELRSLEVESLVSVVSSHRDVREVAVDLQRRAIGEGNIVIEGRDTATTVCPDALLKVFLTASAEERRRRRLEQAAKMGERAGVDAEELAAKMLERDRLDSQRSESPLKTAPDSLFIDTTHLSLEQVVELICQKYLERKWSTP